MKNPRLYLLCGVLIAVAVFSTSTSYGQVNWQKLETAQALTKEAPKPIFIEFTAKWCGWCKKMDKTTFSNEKVIETLNNDFYSVKIDFDTKTPITFKGESFTGKALAEKFGIEGLPTMIYVSSDLENNERIVGYKTSKQLLKELGQMNTKTRM